MGKVDRAADHLVRLSRIDAHTHGHIDRWIELRGHGVLDDLDGAHRAVDLVFLDLLEGLLVCLAALHNCSPCRQVWCASRAGSPTMVTIQLFREPSSNGSAAVWKHENYETVIPI